MSCENIVKIYRPEHPNPQWERKNWRNLNGPWEFDFDFSASAVERKLYLGGALPKTIHVPFCPESELSGIGYKDFMAAVCYRKVVKLTKAETENRVFLHFGAVDYKSEIYVNGKLAKTHLGGFASFSVEITPYVQEGENVIFVHAEDDVRSRQQPGGKQSGRFNSYNCFYTRTTGIWQTVWLEFVPKNYIKHARYYPDIDNGTVTVVGEACGQGTLTLTASYEGKPMGTAKAVVKNRNFQLQLHLAETHLWEVGCGRLYDLTLEFDEDRVQSYFGLRQVRLEGNRFLLNGKTVFLRQVLDQGYYPDGIYTAKTEDELKRDVDISMAAGFNGARLHQKVFEKRFLYHCDKAGYLVWGEHGNWGMDYTSAYAVESFLCEWTEIVERDFNSPAVIGWCPYNETWQYFEYKKTTRHRTIEVVYNATRALDTTRPCIAVSGNFHVPGIMDVHDVHDYCDYETFKAAYENFSDGLVKDQVYRKRGDIQKFIPGTPVFVSEYGGFKWVEGAEHDASWGYGDAPKSREELLQRYTDYTNLLLDNPEIMGLCYTQLYDVEQEQNGLYTYERQPKLDMEKVKAVNTRKAAIED